METGAGVGLEAAAVLTMAPLALFGLELVPGFPAAPPGPVAVAPAPAASRGFSSDC